MHYSVLVLIEKENDDTEGAVAEQLQRFEGPYWDWYVIGGRWSGALDGYKPEKDPKNIERCDFCNGTGTRTDTKVAGGCNACDGTGKRVKWPTEWGQRAGDRQPIEKIKKDFKPYALVVFGRWLDEISAAKFKKEISRDYVRENYDAVIVDCHN